MRYKVEIYKQWNNSSQGIQIVFPILCFAGDTMEHNKLCSLCGGSMSKFPCRMCSTTRDNLDNPAAVLLRKMTNGNKMRELWNQPMT